LASYFVGQCKHQFPNVYTVWRNDRIRHGRTVPWGDPFAWDSTLTNNPSDELMTSAAAQRILDKLSSSIAREVFWKKFVEGQTYEAIATNTAGIKDARAAQNLVFQEKRRLNSDAACDPAHADADQQIIARRS
jgi:hypothetical protein